MFVLHQTIEDAPKKPLNPAELLATGSHPLRRAPCWKPQSPVSIGALLSPKVWKDIIPVPPIPAPCGSGSSAGTASVAAASSQPRPCSAQSRTPLRRPPPLLVNERFFSARALAAAGRPGQFPGTALGGGKPLARSSVASGAATEALRHPPAPRCCKNGLDLNP